MRRSHIVGALLALLAAAPLAAQDPSVHKDFWIGFGFGPGVNLSDGFDGESRWGGNGYLRLGGTPDAKLLLGGEVIAWTREENNVHLSRGNAQFVAMYYPCPCGGLYLKGGLGFASISRSTEQGNTHTTTTKGGLGSGLGVGYELRLGKNLFLVPSADFLFQVFEKDTDPVLGKIPATNTMLLFNLGLTWH